MYPVLGLAVVAAAFVRTLLAVSQIDLLVALVLVP